MEETQNLPKERRLIQESLKKLAEGPEHFMKWAASQPQLDQKFFFRLLKLVEYAQKENKPEIARMLQVLKTSFQKMFNFVEIPEAVAVTADNIRETWKQATSYLEQNHSAEALRLLEAISLLWAHHPNLFPRALLDANIGIAYAQLKQWDKATTFLQKALQDASLSQDCKDKVLYNQANVYRNTGDSSKALSCYEQALASAKTRQDSQMQLVIYHNLAIMSLDQNHLQQAILYAEEARRISSQLGNKELLCDAITRLAFLSGMAGDMQKCHELSQQGLALLNLPASNPGKEH